MKIDDLEDKVRCKPTPNALRGRTGGLGEIYKRKLENKNIYNYYQIKIKNFKNSIAFLYDCFPKLSVNYLNRSIWTKFWALCAQNQTSQPPPFGGSFRNTRPILEGVPGNSVPGSNLAIFAKLPHLHLRVEFLWSFPRKK